MVKKDARLENAAWIAERLAFCCSLGDPESLGLCLGSALFMLISSRRACKEESCIREKLSPRVLERGGRVYKINKGAR